MFLKYKKRNDWSISDLYSDSDTERYIWGNESYSLENHLNDYILSLNNSSFFLFHFALFLLLLFHMADLIWFDMQVWFVLWEYTDGPLVLLLLGNITELRLCVCFILFFYEMELYWWSQEDKELTPLTACTVSLHSLYLGGSQGSCIIFPMVPYPSTMCSTKLHYWTRLTLGGRRSPQHPRSGKKNLVSWSQIHLPLCDICNKLKQFTVYL